MSKLVITSVESENFASALSISHARQGEILDVLEGINEIDDSVAPKTLTEIAAYVSEQMDLNPNEILFLGFKLSQLAQFESMKGVMDEAMMSMLLSGGGKIAEA